MTEKFCGMQRKTYSLRYTLSAKSRAKMTCQCVMKNIQFYSTALHLYLVILTIIILENNTKLLF